MKQAVFCIVPNRFQAEVIIFSLKDAGFLNTDISVLIPGTTGVRDRGYEKHSKGSESVSSDMGAGGLSGGALGWLTGIGALAIPGVGAFIAAGPIMAAFGGTEISVASGSITGGLIAFGMPEYEARQYEGKLLDGNILISIHTDERYAAKHAENIFKIASARDVKRTGMEVVKMS